jgi:hypothetical protein
MYQSFSFPNHNIYFLFLISASLICFLYNVVLMLSFSTSYAVKMSRSKILISSVFHKVPTHLRMSGLCVYVLIFILFFSFFLFFFLLFHIVLIFKYFWSFIFASIDMTCIVIEHLTIL